MAKSNLLSIPGHFSQIAVPRKESRRPKLIGILTMAILGVICNGNSYEHIVETAMVRYQWL